MKNMHLTPATRLLAAAALAATLSLASCNRTANVAQAPPSAEVGGLPAWCRDATIYEVNLRQFTPEGTLQAFAQHLPRLQELGVKILWFMPIHPIGK
ncbi:MAG: hypothetical protein LBS63_01910, partial [Prevotellaceae bacterium]|nr:hypothetical protein [Prevotellaceae bacterium]